MSLGELCNHSEAQTCTGCVMGLKELVGQYIAFCKVTLGSIEESGIKDIVAGNTFHRLHKS